MWPAGGSPWPRGCAAWLLALCGGGRLAGPGVAGGAADGISEGLRASGTRLERFWSLAPYEELRQLLEGADAPAIDSELGLRHVAFVVKATKAREEMAVRMERVWMGATSNRIFLEDELTDGPPESRQVLMNDGSGVHGQRDVMAASRLLIWMRGAVAEGAMNGLAPETEWVVLFGDDVFVNLARLFYFVVQHPAREHPLVFGHCLSDTEAYDFDAPCLDGGAVLLNRLALDAIGEVASCREWPHAVSDQASLGYYAFVNAVPLVHLPALHCHTPRMGDSDRHLVREYPPDSLTTDIIDTGGRPHPCVNVEGDVSPTPYPAPHPDWLDFSPCGRQTASPGPSWAVPFEEPACPALAPRAVLPLHVEDSPLAPSAGLVLLPRVAWDAGSLQDRAAALPTWFDVLWRLGPTGLPTDFQTKTVRISELFGYPPMPLLRARALDSGPPGQRTSSFDIFESVECAPDVFAMAPRHFRS
ncbi:unnamed protein product [Prorocentrum cordatum]|uniref:Hexosyltransferase n=1 Tax=Prorocentrum cordatum TaxID=2364126 RepID=A0ABN9RTE2_9DINO|nr:unnamed protein product [Polarella glacialis]